ncbi:YncE family protein [Nocardia lijiangensis]|uniref:YncE family protein n=1 Tax=Nocardia lijiangensis TaxID=299618 RepID=UPI000AAEFF06|nr:YncE family protein [Nocardia lijiangensis]
MRNVATIAVGARPTCLAAFHDHVWVTNTDDDSVSIIECATKSVIATVNVGSRPAGLTIDPQSGVFVANSGDGTITVLDRDHTFRATIECETSAGGPPQPIGLVNLHAAAMVVVINRKGGVGKIDHGGQLPSSSIFFDGGDHPFVFDGVDRSPHGVAVASDPTRFVYVTNPAADSVSVFDTSAGVPRRRAVTPVGRRPVGVASHPRQPLTYVANSRSDTLSVIRGEEEIAVVDVGPRPFGVTVGPQGHIWVTHDGGAVTVVDALTNTVEATVEVGSRPTGIAVDPRTGQAYVANSGEGTVTVIER